jgi:hypothetical protein
MRSRPPNREYPSARMRILAAAASSDTFWTDTVGLVFTWGVLLPAIATALIVVAIVSGKGDKEADEELRGRWGRRNGSETEV